MVETLSASVYFAALAMLLTANQASSVFPPVQVVTGADSMVERRSVELATTPEQWNSAWQRHKVGVPVGNSNLNFPSIEQAPPVDFRTNEVLVIFGGLAPQGGYQIVDSQKTRNQIVVRINPLSTSLNGGASPRSFNANPYLFAVFKKTKLPFTIQVPVPSQDGSVQWQTVATVGGG